MSKKDEMYLDGGYGLIGNLSTKMVLDNIPKDKAKEYREQLEKENSLAYKQYCEWEKRIKGKW